MSNLKVFGQRMRQHGENVETNAGKLLSDVFTVVSTEAIMRTPIKEGRARRNWQAQKDAPKTSYLDIPATPGDGEKEAITNVRAVASQLKSGDTAHLTNNAPYIAELNRGSSDQAPQMFVQLAVLAALETIKGFRILK